MSKILNVALIFGGRSQEHAASVMSARDMVMALKEDETLRLVPLYITQEGIWVDGSEIVRGENKVNKTTGRVVLPLDNSKRIQILFKNKIKEIKIDVALTWVLGPNGEDGSLPGLMQMAGIPYVGSPIFAAAAGFNKLTTKRYCSALGIPQVPYYAFVREDWQVKKTEVLKNVTKIKLPCFVKPASCGSSIGVSKVKKSSGFVAAIKEALRYDDTVIVEQGVINAIEAECAVIGNTKVKSSIPGAADYEGEWYDYHAKYVAKKWSVNIPPALPQATISKVQKLAEKVFTGLGAAGLARVDFLVDPKTNEVFFNEINTYPTFRAESMVTRLLASIGISYPAALKLLIKLALERQKANSERELSFGGPVKALHL